MNYLHTLKYGHELLAEGKAGKAVEEADKLVQARPEFPKAFYLKALAEHELDNSENAIKTLRRAEELTESHLPLLLQAIIHYDMEEWDKAARTIGGSRLLTHKDNFIASGMERLILYRNNIDNSSLSPFSDSPAIYNIFVAPRLLLYFEEQILNRKTELKLKNSLWAKFESEHPAKRPRSWKTDLPFYLLRLPFILVLRLLRRHRMPLSAEEAFLRGDIKGARKALITNLGSKSGKARDQVLETAAFLSLDLEDYSECLKQLPPMGKRIDPVHEFMRGFCNFHMGQYNRAKKAFSNALAHPMAYYFKGLCQLASGKKPDARKSFTHEIRRSDISIAERILIAGQILGTFPEKLECGITAWPEKE